MIERHIIPGLPEPVSHYCHVTRGGDHVWVSGAVGMDDKGNIPAETVAQFRLALDCVDTCLRHVGAGPQHVVKVTVFLTDIGERASINPLRIEYFGDHRPASTLVEVSKLVLPGLKVEIEAVAYVGP